MHVMRLDNGNSQASLARARYKPHNQPYIVATSSHSDCKANEILYSGGSLGVSGISGNYSKSFSLCRGFEERRTDNAHVCPGDVRLLCTRKCSTSRQKLFFEISLDSALSMLSPCLFKIWYEQPVPFWRYSCFCTRWSSARDLKNGNFYT